MFTTHKTQYTRQGIGLRRIPLQKCSLPFSHDNIMRGIAFFDDNVGLYLQSSTALGLK